MSSNKIKVVLIGNSNVGKTSIINQFLRKNSEEENTKLSGDKFEKELKIEYNSKVENLILEIWNSAGREEIKSVNAIFIKNAKIIIFVYDSTNAKSFNDLKQIWFPLVNKYLDLDFDKMIKCVCANKSDLYEDKEVQIEEGQNFKNEINADIFIETSAYDYESVEELFVNCGKCYLEKKNINKNDTYIEDKDVSKDKIKNHNNEMTHIKMEEVKSSKEEGILSDCCKHCCIF